MPTQLHLAIAQVKPKKGDYPANLARIGRVLADAAALSPRPDVVQLPETVFSGYFLEGGVRDVAVTAGQLAGDLNDAYREAAPDGGELDVVAGFYEVWNNALHNSAIYLTVGGKEGGRIAHVHRKNFLPTYGMFDEERFVDRGHEIAAFDTRWGRAALLVCEDAWHSLSGTIAALDGAQLLFVCAAAPARGLWPRIGEAPGPASVQRWDRLIRDISEEHGIYTTLCNLVGSEGGKMFGGASMVAGPHGDVRGRAPVFEESMLLVSVDIGDLTRTRADMPLLSDLRSSLPHLRAQLERVESGREAVLRYDGAETEARSPETRGGKRKTSSGLRSPASGLPTTRPSDDQCAGPPSLAIDGALTEKWLVEFIRDEMARRGFDRAVVGVSGGVDSAVTAYLAAHALGADKVLAVRLPYRSSSRESLDHAQLVIDALGLPSRTIDISSAVDGYLTHEPDADPARRGNVMARMRMIALFDLSAKLRAIPLGTGNKSERLLGYFTWHADDSPPINPLGDLFKTQVWDLAKHLGIPKEVVEKPPTADLVKGQTDESDFGVTYAKADHILHWTLSGYSTEDLLARGFDEAEVRKVKARLDSTHWKRRLPTVALLSHTGIGESYLRPVDY